MAGAVILFLIAPPAPVPADASAFADLASRTVAGAYHVHTTRSDGAADRATIASAASRAGLRFVIFTDHGDGTRPPDPPAYLDGVVALDGVEISTDEGHYAAIDLTRAPYPLGGAAAAVVEDVARLGGFGIAAHPDSAKPGLRWTDDTAPIDGLEWLNADSEWRNEGRWALARTGLTYWLRPAPSLAMLLDRPGTLDRWDRLTRSRRVTALAGVDAHGGIGYRAEDGGRAGVFGIPSYRSSFSTFTTRVVLDHPMGGDAAGDARLIYAAIRGGRVFTAIDGLAGPALLDFHAETDAGARVEMGGSIPVDIGAKIVARASMPQAGEVSLLRDGAQLIRGTGSLSWPLPRGATGAFRVEAHVPGAPGTPPIPWLVSNPIYVGIQAGDASPIELRPVAALTVDAGLQWHIEKDPTSTAILRTGPAGLELEYQLGPGDRHSQFVAIGADTRGAGFTAIDLELGGSRPARVSVQARGPASQRWGRSVYVDQEPRRILVPLGSLRPIDPRTLPPVRAELVSSMLLVVDLTNATPGWSGTLRLRNSALVR